MIAEISRQFNVPGRRTALEAVWRGAPAAGGGRARSATPSGTAYAVVADLLEDDEEGVLCDTAYRYICLFGSSSLSGTSSSKRRAGCRRQRRRP